MRVLFLLSVLTSMPYLPASAQSLLQGRVLDADTRQPIAYVNIGLPGKDRGTVSDEQGRFRLAGVRAEDTLAFSAIGYDSRLLSAPPEQGPLTVFLNGREYTLPAVEITAVPEEQAQVLGHKLRKKGTSVGFVGAQLGTEIGARIRVSGTTWIQSAHFTINHVRGDSLLFRLNIYALKDDRPAENLLRENVLLQLPQRKGTVDLDLSGLRLIVDEDVLMALEWIGGPGGNEGVTFRGRKSTRGNLYTRLTSQAPFRPVSGQFPGAPEIRLGFYLLGRKVD